MAAVEIRVGGALLPDGLVKMERGDELLWSEGTGRAASTGAMAGSIVARKRTLQLEWGPLTQEQYDALRAALDSSGFMAVTAKVNGAAVASGTFYRSNITGSLGAVAGGEAWWHEVSVQLVEA